MKRYKVSEFTRGWFVGGFEPSIYTTEDVEVAVQHFSKGQIEKKHHHKVATEITVIVSGKARMNDFVLEAGEMVKIEPGEPTDFEALSDTVTTVVKIPGAINDKYMEG